MSTETRVQSWTKGFGEKEKGWLVEVVGINPSTSCIRYVKRSTIWATTTKLDINVVDLAYIPLVLSYTEHVVVLKVW